MSVLCTKEMNGLKLTIGFQDCPDNPREWDSNMFEFIFTNHSRYELGDTHTINFNSFFWELYVREYDKEPRSSKTAYNKLHRDYIIYPVYMREHGGITLSLRDFNDKWDSNILGYAVASRAKIRELLNITRLTPKELSKVFSWCSCELKIYNQYLEGEVYYYVAECEKEPTNNDSCEGFYELESMKNYLPDMYHEILGEIMKEI